jgi:hypothetical protein
MRFQLPALALASAFILWFNVGQDSSAAAFAQRSYDLADSRPARSILIIGNSRTYYNSMPAMLRKIADSTKSPTKFEIETSAKPGASFETLWHDSRTTRLLGAGWDDVILQGESRAQSSEELNASFLTYGAKLAQVAKLNQGHPRLVVNWDYDPSLYEGDSDGEGRASHLELVKSMHARLGSEADMGRVNVAGLWESVRRSHPSIKLTTDGNHPTVAGSYLFALALYANLSSSPVSGVTYAPDGLAPEDAEALRRAVDSFPVSSS